MPEGPEDISPDSESDVDKKGDFREAFVLDSSAVTPKQEKKKPIKGKDYKYVKESFMSDSAASGDPLSDMGAILAGEFKGKHFTGRKISLDFKDAEIRSIFRLLADISKLNLIISDDVGGSSYRSTR